MWNDLHRIVCIFHCIKRNIMFFNSDVPVRSGALASLRSIKGHCHTKRTTAATFSHDTLQTLGETLETNLTACIPELETVKSSLNNHLYSSPSHSFPHLIDVDLFFPSRISCQNLFSRHVWGCTYFKRHVFLLWTWIKSSSQVKSDDIECCGASESSCTRYSACTVS